MLEAYMSAQTLERREYECAHGRPLKIQREANQRQHEAATAAIALSICHKLLQEHCRHRRSEDLSSRGSY